MGDLIQKVDGTHGVVQFNTIEYRTQTMYNLTVDIAHTFYVGDGDWLVHNCGDVDEITEGIYEFTSQSGLTYVGQSKNINTRLRQHLKTGNLPADQLDNVQRTGGKQAVKSQNNRE